MTASGQSAKENIPWIDIETDGLDYFKGGNVLEIACVVTDSDLNILDEGHPFHAVVAYSEYAMYQMMAKARPVVQEMHTKTGLWMETLSPFAARREDIDVDLQKYLAMYGAPGNMAVGGNSVRLDLNFLEDRFPVTYGYLNYQMRDVTSLAKFAQAWWGIEPFVKLGSHNAMDDIMESIAEAKYYKRRIEEIV